MARKTIDQLYALTVPEIQEAFLMVMQDVVNRAMLDEMMRAIENNDAEGLFKATGFTPAALAPILDRIEQAYKNAAESESALWPKRISTPVGPVMFRFDMRNIIVEKDLRDFSSQFITRMTEEARNNVRLGLQRGMVVGNNPRETALNIVGRINPSSGKREGGVIGLSISQENWAANAKRYLEQFDNRYFNLSLRDKRFDSIVRKAFENEKALSTTDVNKITTAYKSRALKYRGETIARTETIQALNRGAAASYAQAINEGTLLRQQITKEWDDVGDGKTRHTHRTMGSKYSKDKGIDLEDAFVSPAGSKLMFPGDQSLGANPNEIINCRCKTRYRVNWRYGLENV